MKPIAIAAVIFAVAMADAADEKKANELIQAAQAKEVVQGDLKAAIELYGQAIKEAGANRQLAVKSLLRLAECYQKMGNAEARKIYEQVARDYADQKDAAALARAKLGKEPGAGHSLAFRQLWKAPQKVSLDGNVSSDGRYLPYVAWAEHGDLFLHDFTTDVDRRLTNTGTDGMARTAGQVDEFAEEAVVSPDGRKVVYSWYTAGTRDRYDVRIVDLKEEGIPRAKVILDNADISWTRPDDWSPDGRWIAVQIERRDQTVQIGLLSAADGSLRILKSIDWRGAGRMFFSPDGKYLGYDLPESDTRQERYVFVMAVDGSREVPVVAHRGRALMMGWSPDGKRLLFASDRSGSMDLWSAPFVDGRTQGEPEVIKADIGTARAAGVSRSGAMYLWVPPGAGQRSRIQVAAFDVNAGRLLSAPVDVAQDYLEFNVSPEWSPDGKSLAYLSSRTIMGTTDTGLVIRSAETGQMIRELRPKVSNFYSGPRWSSDGRALMVQGRDVKGRWGIYRVDAQTGDVFPLLLDPTRDIFYPSWTLDGKGIYFSRRISGGTAYAIVQRDLTSGAEKELLQRPFAVMDRVSPDGRYLGISSVDAARRTRVKLVLPVEGGEPREVMSAAAGVDAALLSNYGRGVALIGNNWAPDGRSFFTRKHFNDGSQDEIWKVPLDGGAPTKTDLGSVTAFQVSADGKQIALANSEKAPPRGQEVWVLENFLPTLTAGK